VEKGSSAVAKNALLTRLDYVRTVKAYCSPPIEMKGGRVGNHGGTSGKKKNLGGENASNEDLKTLLIGPGGVFNMGGKEKEGKGRKSCKYTK